MASCVNSEIVCVTVFVSHQVYFLYTLREWNMYIKSE